MKKCKIYYKLMDTDAQKFFNEGKQEIMLFDRTQQFLIQPDGVNWGKKTSVMSTITKYLPQSHSSKDFDMDTKS